MTGLAILSIPALDGEEPTVEVHASPTQLENLTAPQSRVDAQQYGGRQMIAKVRQPRQQVLVPLLPSFIGRRAPILHFLIARLQCVPKPRFLGLIKKAYLASTIDARLIDASHG